MRWEQPLHTRLLLARASKKEVTIVLHSFTLKDCLVVVNLFKYRSFFLGWLMVYDVALNTKVLFTLCYFLGLKYSQRQ